MTDFEYERDIYNRNFLNCSQRQSIVMLKSIGYPVDNLFYNAQVTTDIIREQIYVQQTPRYDFTYDGLTYEDFGAIGVECAEKKFDSFCEAIPQLIEIIQRDGFVLAACDVFRVPHRPEFFNKKHILHFITLLSYDLENENWSAIDDLSSGNLAKFNFSNEYVSEICDAAPNKVYRVFKKSPVQDGVEEFSRFESLFRQSRHHRVDNFEILNDIDSIEENEQGLARMANVFSLMFGSRVCFAQFLKQKEIYLNAARCSENIALKSRSMRDFLNICAITGRLKKDRVLSDVEDVVRMERELSKLLEECLE